MVLYESPRLPNKEDISNSDGSELNDIDTATYNAFNSSLAGIRVHGIYTSAAQSVTTGTTTFTHGLGDKPTMATLYLVCIGTDQGYSIGDKIVPSISHHGILGSEFMIFIPGDNLETQISVTLGNFDSGGSGIFAAVNQSTYTVVALDDSKWEWYLEAYRFNSTTTDSGHYSLQTDATGTSDVTQYNDIADASDTSFTDALIDVITGDYFTGAITEKDEESGIAIASGDGAYAHGLSSSPSLLSVNIVCTSTDLGYLVGDVVCISHQPNYQHDSTDPNYGVDLEVDATNIHYWIPLNNICVANQLDVSATFPYQTAAIDPFKWTMTITAWA